MRAGFSWLAPLPCMISVPLMEAPLLSASVLAADMSRLAQVCADLKTSGVPWVHLDVMDGRFVPNLTFGAPLIKSLRPHTDLVLDAHLMVVEPEKIVPDMIDAGCDVITFHLEATDHPQRLLSVIRQAGVKAGLSLNPATPLTQLAYLAEDLDLLLLMSVNPGFAGQKFVPAVRRKLDEAVALRDKLGAAFQIQMDGGVGPGNVVDLKRAGLDVAVMGSALFGGGGVAANMAALQDLFARAEAPA